MTDKTFQHKIIVMTNVIDESDKWSDEDLRNFTAASRFVEISVEEHE